jgi:hypothetical protein
MEGKFVAQVCWLVRRQARFFVKKYLKISIFSALVAQTFLFVRQAGTFILETFEATFMVFQNFA